MSKSRPRRFRQASTQQGRSALTPVTAPGSTDRRKALMKFRNGLLLAAGFGGGSLYIGSSVITGMHEADLSRIGNGVPTIVQIHDPQCPTCRALQREVRQALERFEAGQLQYLVADIRKDNGRAFAEKHRVGHVTLLLFDGNGTRTEVINGFTKSAYLKKSFERHAEQKDRH